MPTSRRLIARRRWSRTSTDSHVGFVTVVRHSPYAAELQVMAVRPELHRQGIGRALVLEAERRLRSEGIEYL